MVEDDAGSRRFVAWLLGMRTGHEVMAFATAEAALEQLHRLPPSILLADLGLPGQSGEDLARAAARLPEPPRIILMSGDPIRLERARPLADRLLAKPFSIPEFLRVFEPPLEGTSLEPNLEEA